MSKPRQVEVGIITGAHGIKGQVTVFSHTTPPEAIADMQLHHKSGDACKLKITGHKKNILIANINDVRDRNAAELLKGSKLFADANASNLPAKSTLPGLPAYTKDGKLYGTILQVHNFGAGDIVEIEKPDGETEMLPLAKGFAEIVDNIVVVTPPEYMEVNK